MNIAYIANPADEHDCKWINNFARSNDVYLLCPPLDADANLHLDQAAVALCPILPTQFPVGDVGARLRLRWLLEEFVNKNKIDVLHSMYAYPNAFYASEIGFRRHIVTTRGSDLFVDYRALNSPRGLRQRLVFRYLRRLFRRALDQAAYVTSTSRSQQSAVRGLIRDPAKSILIRTGIDTTLLQEYTHSQARSRNPAEYVVFSPRSMKPLYNQELILEGFRAFQAAYKTKRPRLVLINDHPNTDYAALIGQKIQQLGLLNAVSLLGKQSLREMVKNYLAADVAVMAPRSDGTPNTALEAMFLRCPLILGSIEYDPDLFALDSIWRMTNDSPNELARVLLCCAHQEGGALTAKSQNAFARVSNHATLAVAVEKVADLYASIDKVAP